MSLENTPLTLMEGYTVRVCSREEFREVFATWGERLVHEDAPVFRFRETYSDAERELLEPLAAAMESHWALYLLVEKDGALAAWHTGSQDAADTFYMRSSAVVHEHRRKGRAASQPWGTQNCYWLKRGNITLFGRGKSKPIAWTQEPIPCTV